jgi:hypothetical protein
VIYETRIYIFLNCVRSWLRADFLIGQTMDAKARRSRKTITNSDPKNRFVASLTMTFLAATARHLARRQVPMVARRSLASLDQFEEYGKNVFTGKVADEYLAKHGKSGDILKDPTWVNKHADTVAMAVFDW